MTGRQISLEEAFKIPEKQVHSYFRQHVNPGLLSIYKILGFDAMDIEKAEGCEFVLKSGERVLDLTSGLGVLALGHNHPDIIATQEYCNEHQVVDILKLGVHRLQAVLAHNIASCLPDPLEVCYFSVSGSEANESAIKLMTRAQPLHKKYFICTEGGYHGKTHGSLSMTFSEGFRDHFHVGIPVENVIVVPYGDAAAVERAIAEKTQNGKCDIAGMILEPIQGQELVIPPAGYLRAVVDICHKHDILVTMDEVKAGMGRTGKLFAFMYEDVVPDVVTISKAIGGGKSAMGIMVTSKAIWKKAYGKKKDSALHSTTFGGIGQTCAIGIKALEIISEPAFLETVRKRGQYLQSRLEELKAAHPSTISRVFGRGLMVAIEFNFTGIKTDSSKIPKIPFLKDVNTVFMGCIIRHLYRKHRVLCSFAPPKPNLLMLLPPLIITEAEIDRFVDALSSCLDDGLVKLFYRFVKGNVKETIIPAQTPRPSSQNLLAAEQN